MERDRRRWRALHQGRLRRIPYPSTLSGGMWLNGPHWPEPWSTGPGLLMSPQARCPDTPPAPGRGSSDCGSSASPPSWSPTTWTRPLRLSNRVLVLSERPARIMPTSRCPSSTSRVTRSASCVGRTRPGASSERASRDRLLTWDPACGARSSADSPVAWAQERDPCPVDPVWVLLHLVCGTSTSVSLCS